MILANIASASYVEKAKRACAVPCSRYSGEEGSQAGFLSELGFALEGGLSPSPFGVLAQLMQQINEREDRELIKLCCLKRAQ
ncbi:hypothetical protein O9992_10685 [Vibrio lentus]|nr:hypothetical protein [Vibrio lentus]